MSGLFILVVLILFLFIISFVFTQKDIMAPSVIMCIMFLISSTFALLNVENWNIKKYSFDAVLIIVSGIFTFMITEILFRFMFCNALRGKRISSEHIIFLEYEIKSWKLNFIIVVNIIILLFYLRSIMKVVGSASNLSSYFIAYRRLGISNMKYGGEDMNSGIMNQLLKIVSASGYATTYLLSNKIVSKSKNILEKVKMVSIIIIAMMPSFMTAGRSGMLRMLSAFLIEYYIVWHQKNGWYKNLSWKYVKYGLVLFFLGSFVFVYSLNWIGRQHSRKFMDYISDYVAGGIQMFNLYIQNPIPRKVFGEETLYSVMKIVRFIGISNSSASYNLEFRRLGVGHNNVYTFFRRPLHDFGLLGMYVFVALIAILFAYIYFNKIKYRDVQLAEKWVLLLGYLYYWLVCSSIDQYSITYISVGTVLIYIFIVLIFNFMVKTNNDRKP